MWTVFTACSFVVGYWLSSAFESLVFTWALPKLEPPLVLWLTTLAYAFGFGIAFGIAHGLVFYYLSGPGQAVKWGALSGAGGMIGIGLQTAYVLVISPEPGLAIHLLPGLSLGFAQWLRLRKLAAGSWTWILLNFISWPVSAGLAELLRGFDGLVVAGLVFGALTGLTLSLLLTQPVPPRTPEPAGHSE
jgi:hypothetical protein